MGLGSKELQSKQEIKAAVGKSDWKAHINGIDDAERVMDKIKQNLSIDPNGEYLMEAYMSRKMRQLEAYVDRVKTKGAITFKDFCRDQED